MIELVLLKLDSEELKYVWSYLAGHPINQGLENPTSALNDGQEWMYMGTFTDGKRYLHQARHRFHPKCDCVKSISLDASKEFNPDTDIEKKLKL